MTTSPSALRDSDVRLRPGPGRGEAALAAFDTLVAGQALVILAESESRDLLGRLQAERKGMFEWSLLEAGPASFRIQITRRAAERGACREVGEALAWDHDRLDALERQAFERLAAGDAAGALAVWGEPSGSGGTSDSRRGSSFRPSRSDSAFRPRPALPP